MHTATTPIGVTCRPNWLPTDCYPFEINSMEINESTISYVDEGTGPTLLFVHTGMWSFIFRDAILRLRQDHRCIALDFPGYGISPDATTELDLIDQADLLAAFVRELDLQDVVMILHDLGGPIGARAAIEERSRIIGLVLMNTFVWRPEGKALRAMLHLMSSRPMTAVGTRSGLLPLLTSTRFGVGRRLTARDRRAFLGPFADRKRTRRFHQTMSYALDPATFDTDLTLIRELPVLTIFGEHNDPFGFQKRHHELFADHVAVVVEGGNHFPMCDDPELVASSIRRWRASRT